MSKQTTLRRKTSSTIRNRKGGEPIVVLTAYDTLIANLLDEHCDILLVGDSLGMVRHGLETTVPVSLEMMILHAQAVMRGSNQAMVVVDMPFGSYQESKEAAFRNATRILQETGAQSVKLEGGEEMAETIRYLTKRGIAVMGHVGLTPQHVQQMGGFKIQGKNEASWNKAVRDAMAVDKAGAFAMVIEGVVEPLAQEISQAVAVPTIGIGASNQCDGQVLVTEDMLGLTDTPPKFVRHYANLREQISQAASDYAAEVKNRSFPSDAECYAVPKEAEKAS